MPTRLSIAFRSRGDPSLLIPSARRAEAAGFRRIWLVEVRETDVLVLASALAQSTKRIGLASGVVNSHLRLPYLLALAAATVSDLSGSRFVLGIGAGSPPMGYARPIESDTPVRRLRETIRIVRPLLAGEAVDLEGRLFEARNLTLGVKPKGKVPVYSAAMGLGTVRLAAELADGVLLMLPSRRFVAAAKDAISETLSRREDPPTSFGVGCHLVCCVSKDRRMAEANARLTVARYSTIPTYRENFRRLGFESELAEFEPIAKAKGLQAAAEKVDRRMADELVIHGTPSECLAKIEGFVEAGVTEPIVYPSEAGDSPTSLDATIAFMGRRRGGGRSATENRRSPRGPR